MKSPDGTQFDVHEVDGMPHTNVDFNGVENPVGKWGRDDDEGDDELVCKPVADVQTQCHSLFLGPAEGIPLPSDRQSSYGPIRRTDASLHVKRVLNSNS